MVAEQTEMLDRLLDQHLSLTSCAFDAKQGDEIRLALNCVLSDALAGSPLTPGRIQEIIGNLKGKTKRLRITAKARVRLRGRTAEQCTRFHGPIDDSTRLQALEASDRFDVR